MAMVFQDQYLADCFPEPSLTEYRKPKNFINLLINATTKTKTNVQWINRVEKGVLYAYLIINERILEYQQQKNLPKTM